MPRERVETVQLMLRLPPELHAEVVRAAKANDRSMNGQIVAFLREALASRPKPRAKRTT